MEYLKHILKKSGWTSLIESIIFALIGLILIRNPEGTVSFISVFLGIALIIIGVYKIMVQLMAKEKGSLYENGIVFGIMMIILGIVTIAFGKEISTVFSVVTGIWIIYSAILRILSSLRLKEINGTSKIWIISLILSILILICGICILVNSATLVATIGVFILIYSVTDICENLILLRFLEQKNP